MGTKVADADSFRFDILDFYRYVAAIGVAAFHFALYLPNLTAPTLRFINHLQFLVDFFFVLSGFVIMHVYAAQMKDGRDFLRYLQKRLARVYPLHALTLAIFVGIGACAAAGLLTVENPARYSSAAILPNLLLIHAWGTLDSVTFNYPSWSISAEFFVYLLFPALLFATNRLGRIAALGLVLLLAVLVATLFKAAGFGVWTQATFQMGCLRAVPTFLAGMVMCRFAKDSSMGWPIPIWVGHAAAFATLALMWLDARDEIVIASFVLAVYAIARSELSSPRGVLSLAPFRLLANASYGVYMLHPIIALVLLRIIPKVSHLNATILDGLAALALAITTLAAILCFKIFENPARRALTHTMVLTSKPLVRAAPHGAPADG